MKVCLLVYHKNLKLLYPPEWIEDYKQSILNQTYKDFDIFEIDYGGTTEMIFEKSYYFDSVEMPTFIHALNYLLDKVFAAGYDCICNSNVDDIFHIMRLEKQIPFIAAGYDIVSSNFKRIFEGTEKFEWLDFDEADIKKELSEDHNVIGHPCVTYSRHFIEHNRYVPEHQPYEDIKLWQKTIDSFKFIILPEILFTHRVHSNSVCQSENR